MKNILSDGYGLIPKMVMRDHGIGVYAKAVIAYMLSYSGAGWNDCWPSMDTISTDLKISRGTATKAIKELCAHGYIKKQVVFDHATFKRHNNYCILINLPDVSTAINGRTPRKRPTVTTCTPDVHQVDGNSIPLSSNNGLVKDPTPTVVEPKILSGHSLIVDTYWKLFEKWSGGNAKPVITARCGKALKELRGRMDDANILTALERYFNPPEQFNVTQGLTLHRFCACAVGLLAGTASKRKRESLDDHMAMLAEKIKKERGET